MAAQKFIAYVGSRLTERAGLVTSAGAGSDGALVALDPSGKIDMSMLPAGIGANTLAIVASEILTAGNVVNIWNDAGTAKVRKADATSVGKEANGFVTAGVAIAATATVHLPGGVITGLTGLTAGTRMFLGTTAGLLVATAPSATGNIAQLVGIAANATTLIFEPEEPITRA